MNEPRFAITHRIEAQGRWLFHRRSLVGLTILPILPLAFWQPGFPGNNLTPTALNNLGVIGFAVSLFGLALRWLTVAPIASDTSRRSTRELSARELNTRGLYSIVRHPLYFANALIVSGWVLASGSLWFFLAFQCMHALYVERVMACEDRFLAGEHGNAWRHWAARTPAFLPRPSLWQGNVSGHSLRNILRREYNGLFLTCLAFFALQSVHGTLVQHQPLWPWIEQHPFWTWVLVAGLLGLLVLRTLKKHTRLLHVPSLGKRTERLPR